MASSSVSKKKDGTAAVLLLAEGEIGGFDNGSGSSSHISNSIDGPSSLAVATSHTEIRHRAHLSSRHKSKEGDDDDDLFRSSSAPTTAATTAPTTTTANLTSATATFSSSSVSTTSSSANAGANTTASSLSLTVTTGTPEAEVARGGGTNSSDDGNSGEGCLQDGVRKDEEGVRHKGAYDHRASSASMTAGAAAGGAGGNSQGDDDARYSTGDDNDLDGDGVSTAFSADESWEFTIATSSSQQQSSSQRKSGVNASLRRSSASGKAPPPQALRSSANKSHRLQQFTVNKLQFHKLGHLYGRDDELSKLQTCWDDICGTNSTSPAAADKAPTSSTTHQSGARRFVTIRGASGTGKSALAESLRPSVLKRGGLYLQGKFPQQLRLSRQSVEPYAAFAAACQELCDVVLSLDDDDGTKNGAGDNGSTGSSSYHDRFPYRKSFTYSLSDLRRKLDRELGRDAHVLIKVIPGLKQILSASSTQQQSPVQPQDGGATIEGADAAAVANGTNPSTTNDDADEATSFQQAQHQFKFAFRKFVRVLTGFGPVVLVLDDLQWADVASMELVEALLTDREASKIMLIGSYRDDDLYQNMPHLSTVATLKEHAAGAAASLVGPESAAGAGLHVEEILVGNLDVNQVNELLVDLLSSKRPDTDGLAECVHKKTLGNVFFVIQFLTLLHDSDLLTYNFGVMGWKWDVPTIQLRTAATENVVGLMYAKMKGLPESIGRALPVLACLGSSFTTSVFELVARRFQWKDDLQRNQAEAKSSDVHGDEAATTAVTAPSDGDHPESHPEERPIQEPLTASSVLDFCVDQGLIEKAGEDAGAKRYQWVHDKIQEAAFTLVTEPELNTLKLQLGKILFEDFTAKELEKNLFLVANLLATDSKDDPTSLPRQKPIEMASLYLRAGNKAIEKAAFDQATGYLLAGIGLLPPNHWQDHYQLSLELYSSAAEGFFCTGNFEQMSAHCHEVIRQADKPILDKRRVYTVLIDATGAAGRQQEALGVCRDVLAKLGHKFPNRAVLLHVLGGIVKIKSTLKKTTSHELVAKLPTMEDPEKLMAMAMFDKSVTWMYNTKSDLLPLAVFKGLKMTMQDGVSVYSPVVFSLVGFLLSGVVFDFKGGAAFGDQAVELLKQARGSRKVESRVQFIVHCFVFCWLRPISLSIKPLLAAYELGMATGDTESGSWCIYFYLEYQFRTGTPLEALIADCAFYAEHVREVKMNNILALLTNLWQTALFLTGANSFDGTFTGELVRQKVALEEAGEFYDYLFIAIHRTLMYTQFVLGRHELVYESIKKTEMDNCGYEKGFPGIAGIYHLYAFNGFSLISLYRETKNKKYLKMAKQFAAKIKTWANGENPNVTHYDSLFDAEFDSLRGATYSAAKQYEVAIVYAGRRGFTQDRALAHELFGEHLARLNPAEHGQDAEFQLNQAIKLYTEWGAHAKVRQMNAKHTKILAPPSEIQIDVTS